MPKAKSNLPPKYVLDPLTAALAQATSSRPPRYQPRIPPTLNGVYAADPFDPKFVVNSAGRDLTALGVCVNIWWWFKRNEAEVGPAFKPIAGSLRVLLARECPDTLEELEAHEQDDPTQARPG